MRPRIRAHLVGLMCRSIKQLNAIMKTMHRFLILGLTAFTTLAAQAAGAEKAKCPITGKAANPKCSYEYEGKTYTFCTGKCREEFKQARLNSLYHKLGGKAAINAAVDAFYVKVLADKRVNHFFEDVNMSRQHNKQKAFLAAAFGGPEPWTGKDMRKAHASLNLNETHFNAIAGHLQTTLQELKVPADLIAQVMAIAASTKDDVLNRPAKKSK